MRTGCQVYLISFIFRLNNLSGLEIAIFEFLVGQVEPCSSLGQDRRFDIRVENLLAIKEGDRMVIRFYPQIVDNFVNKIGDSQVL